MKQKVFAIIADYFKLTSEHIIKRSCSCVKTTEDYDNGGFNNINVDNTFSTKDSADAQVKILEQYAESKGDVETFFTVEEFEL